MISTINRIWITIKNIIVFFVGILVGKTNKVILLGAWMGEKFADNPRFLFQFLHKNKKELGLYRVIWATRSKKVFEQLNDKGYECVLVGTVKSFYWHCKAGIHIICNMQVDSGEYKSDIDSSLSAGARKIQLWHGNGIKCVPGSSGSYNTIRKWLKRLSTQGYWYVGNYYFVCKSDIDFDFFERKFSTPRNMCIDSAYPRTCTCLEYLDEENEVLKIIKKYHKTILFLPTFRKDYKNYIHPLENEDLLKYIENNNIIWVEKPHSADRNSQTIRKIDSPNVLSLGSEFDINVLMPLIDLLVTDYSSAMLDALFFRKQIIYYVPDYEYYIKDDRGFLIDYDSVCITPKLLDCKDLPNAIDCALKILSYDENSENIRKLFWKHPEWSYAEIWNTLTQI